MQTHIILGIDETSDIETLLGEGIRQFYFGYIPPAYQSRYATQHGLNRRYRPSEQFSSLTNAYHTITQIQEAGGSIYLALNAFGSNETMLAESSALYDLFGARVDGIIVATVAMAVMLRALGYRQIVTSNLFGVYTPQAVAFLQAQFAPIKIILPRDISLENIAQIVTAYPEQDFECFLYGDNCRYSEGFCFVEHGYDSVGFGSLCSYASGHKKPIQTASVEFKHLAKDPTLSTEEKKAQLSKVPLDIASILDRCVVYRHEKSFGELHQMVELLSRYDLQLFGRDRTLMLRTLEMLTGIESPSAERLRATLSQAQPHTPDTYRSFHKLNAPAIAKTVAFFAKYENIVSYKIPSRGRSHYRHLLEPDSTETYNYQESQYPL